MSAVGFERETLMGELAALRRREALLWAVTQSSGAADEVVDLVAAVVEPVTSGATHRWLVDALTASVARERES
ncbi:hypothetical protein [Nocardia caishijiensis]|uniref:Uncharacterized protein n=1 Tax=Nocardia caishijiensis TaxID=184756 RepID=A0ABQ6YND1_9NOCA|nr:hypothetical protein [Nocardia caishijiensis]KAF0847304.1 hypothetical protein FNL39_103202 [Nocardia caishijiensis]